MLSRIWVLSFIQEQICRYPSYLEGLKTIAGNLRIAEIQTLGLFLSVSYSRMTNSYFASLPLQCRAIIHFNPYGFLPSEEVTFLWRPKP